MTQQLQLLPTCTVTAVLKQLLLDQQIELVSYNKATGQTYVQDVGPCDAEPYVACPDFISFLILQAMLTEI